MCKLNYPIKQSHSLWSNNCFRQLQINKLLSFHHNTIDLMKDYSFFSEWDSEWTSHFNWFVCYFQCIANGRALDLKLVQRFPFKTLNECKFLIMNYSFADQHRSTSQKNSKTKRHLAIHRNEMFELGVCCDATKYWKIDQFVCNESVCNLSVVWPIHWQWQMCLGFAWENACGNGGKVGQWDRLNGQALWLPFIQASGVLND